MRKDNPEIEKYRITEGRLGSDSSFGNNGAFIIPVRGAKLVVIASDGAGWEHVSVSLKRRTPFWEEMCLVKDLFWGEFETVIQYHPTKSNYVNNDPNCLHMWRPLGAILPLPPEWMVGDKRLGPLR